MTPVRALAVPVGRASPSRATTGPAGRIARTFPRADLALWAAGLTFYGVLGLVPAVLGSRPEALRTLGSLPFGGLPVFGAVADLTLWLFVLHLVLLAGYRLLLVLDDRDRRVPGA